MNGQTSVIRTDDLAKTFRSRRGDEVVAVAGLNLTVARGETYGLIGPDGAGKTTTIRLLTSLLTPTRGSATVLGYDTMKQTRDVRERIGYVAQRFSLFGDMTVWENLRFFANTYGISARNQRARMRQLVKFAGLEGFEDRLGHQLSGGMKKKLALACMLIHQPEVVFLDEPTQGVDPVSRREFWDLLAALRRERGLTTFVSTPYMDEAERCHRIGLIYAGRLVAQGTPGEIKRLVPGQLMECRPSDFENAKVLAPTLPGVLEMQTLGNRLCLFVDDAPRRLPEIKAAMSRHNIELNDLRMIQPRVEEAFVSLVQQRMESGAEIADRRGEN